MQGGRGACVAGFYRRSENGTEREAGWGGIAWGIDCGA